MNVFVYKLTCLTDLHVGSGDVNYNIVDNEVVRDPVTGYPMIPSSGLKGALRDHFSKTMDTAEINRIFGSPSTAEERQGGQYKFLSAYLLSRPLRVDDPDGQRASISVTSQDAFNSFQKAMEQFGCKTPAPDQYFNLDFGNSSFLTTKTGIEIEGESTHALQNPLNLKRIIGSHYAVAKNLNDYPLPVVARNQLDNGISQNLWYEEIVPHGSLFYFMILTPEEERQCALDFSSPLQIGANASIGRGLVQIRSLSSPVETEAAHE